MNHVYIHIYVSKWILFHFPSGWLGEHQDQEISKLAATGTARVVNVPSAKMAEAVRAESSWDVNGTSKVVKSIGLSFGLHVCSKWNKAWLIAWQAVLLWMIGAHLGFEAHESKNKGSSQEYVYIRPKMDMARNGEFQCRKYGSWNCKK